MIRAFAAYLMLFLAASLGYAEGSKNLTPANSGSATGANSFIGYLQHDDGPRSNGFLKSTASDDEKLYVYLKAGETLYYGLRRISTNDDVIHSNLTIYIRENDGTLASTATITRNTGSFRQASFNTSQDGVIESYEQVAAGPAAIVGGSGYRALSYTNTTGEDQDFYIYFDEGAAGTADDQKGWYDLWDFSVYNGQQEKPGRLHSKAWSITSGGDNNLLSDEFQMYALIPSDLGGVSSGYYVKEIDISGIRPFGMLIYANSTGADLSQVTDTNLDGNTDFLDARMSQDNDIAELEYDLFINNPDIDLYPTSVLPSVVISDANFYCNSAGTGGEGVIYFESNQDGFISLLLDLNGITGYQYGTSDVIVEKEIAVGSEVVRWDGLDGSGNPVPSGTTLTISGRFTSGPLHVPLWDVESNAAGITMLDVRPATSFNLIYWDDSQRAIGSNPGTEFDGTNTSQHTWADGNEELVNTWSFGYYQINSQNLTYTYTCDPDGDGVDASVDLDSDNDGVADANEGPGDFNADTDGDGTPDYLDSDLPGFIDTNYDGVNDNYDADLDGIPDGMDLDSDNDGIPDMVENGLTDANTDGTLNEGSGITDANGNGLADAYDPACTNVSTPVSGNATSRTSNSVDNPDNALGAPDGNRSTLNATGDWLILDMGGMRPSGAIVTINSRIAGNANHSAHILGVGQSTSGTNGDQTNPSTYTYASQGNDQDNSYTLSGTARYIHLRLSTDGGNQGIQIDGLTYNYNQLINPCGTTFGSLLILSDSDSDGTPNYLDLDSDDDGIVDVIEAGGTADASTGKISGFADANRNGLNDTQEIVALTRPNTDGDGFRDYVDIDSDNDGLQDHIEAQRSSAYIAIAYADTDSNGLIDVYDPNNGGTFLIPVNTDGTGLADYRDTDADGDGVPDIIEGWDSNLNGISDLDTDGDGDIDNADACAPYTSSGLLRTENADFENGLKGLASFSGDVFVTTDYQSGSSAIVAGPAEGGVSTSDFIPINPGQQLTFTGYAKVAGSPTWAGIGFTYWDASQTTRTSEHGIQVTTNSYAAGNPHTTTATAPAGTAFVEVWTYKQGPGTLTFDNFSLVISGGCPGSPTLATDSDNDGLYDIFEHFNPPLQNTDEADEQDWQDSNDDNDNSPTAGEDVNANGNWADDFTEGGITIPDYLFKGDYDGDAIADKNDADSDNDGITDITEANGEAVNPSGDSDNDGVPNYKDSNVSNLLSSAADQNGDGIYDVFDSDLDGVPDFLDLDSDNDGIWDAIEANSGSIPFELNQITGMFQLKDPDNDGLMNDIDSNPNNVGGNSTLANPDSDSDGIRDYLDTDTDADGITDIIEAQTTLAYRALTGVDTDGDGIDDSFDPSNGGSLIVPVNTDGLDLQDYLDDDSDNDNVPDSIEGHDANFDGLADATPSGSDTDGDGQDNAFDADNGGTTAPLQNTDGTDQKDWRDANDDNDDALTINEDANTNGNYADDQTNGQSGVIPDYLFNGDKDGNGIFDDPDGDSDNDGIADTREDNGETIDPSGDEDNDGIPNFRDSNDAAVTTALSSTVDSNGDGIFDIFDRDLDGLPDFLDLDSDNDGIPDIIEAGGIDADDDGTADCGNEIYLEAECFSYGSSWSINNDAAASNGSYVVYSGANTINTPPAAVDNYLTYTFEICTPGTYSVYLLARTEGGGDDSFWISANDSDTTKFNEVNAGVATFQWDRLHDSDNGNASVSYTFSAGWNTLRIGYREAGAELDKIFITLGGATPSGNGQSTINCLSPADTDNDGLNNTVDLDADNDGLTDIVEAGGTDSNGDGKVDTSTDSDSDGLADVVDIHNGGTAYSIPDTDDDNVSDYLDVDSDNDGITDPSENGAADTNNDGRIDGHANDTDGDGLANSVDPDNGGTPISQRDTDGDGVYDFRDLDSDNDGYPDISEGGGTDADNDGIVDRMNDTDNDGIPDIADVSQTAGSDADGDGIDNIADIDFAGGTDTDGDGIINIYDPDADGDGFDDYTESYPYALRDTDGDGNKDFRDLDSDNDGIVDVLEFGLTVNAATGTIGSFSDANGNGLNDTQESSPVTPPNTDGDAVRDFRDIDSDNDGIVDIYESQTKNTYRALSGVDTDNDGLDDVYDPNNGGTLTSVVNTDGTGGADYLESDSDDDGVNDNIEGANANKDQYADWDAVGNNNLITDETGYNVDADMDGLWDVFDNNPGTGNTNITGSTSAVQDTDKDGNWDFQDVDDDNDGINTSAEAKTPNEDPNGVIPDYLFGNQDSDGDGINDNLDLDSDNDGLQDTAEDGSTGINPSGDLDGDGLMNFEDSDMDGDGTANSADTDADANAVTDTWSKADANADGVLDVFDKDRDGIPNFRDRDSDNDGIADVLELGLTDADKDGTLNEGSGITDANGNGLADAYDPSCTNQTITAYASAVSDFANAVNTANALNSQETPTSLAAEVQGTSSSGYITLDLGRTVNSGTVIDIYMARNGNTSQNVTAQIQRSTNATTGFAGGQTYTLGNVTTRTQYTYTLGANARYLRIAKTSTSGTRHLLVYDLSYNYTGNPCGATFGTALSPSDTDSDGIANYLDLDSDNDGITDNREAQTAAGYRAPAAGDGDSDGILNIYDEDIAAGNALTPLNADGVAGADYIDTDADNDGVLDIIEGWDADSDGFADWDTDGDNEPTDEAGYSNDNDQDGIRYLFDSNIGIGTIANINGSNQALQDTDADGTPNWRDTDDDDDSYLTSAEDVSSNGIWTDDFTQGGNPSPDYLFNPDQDGDGVLDFQDGDADNDGIASIDEFAFGVIPVPAGGLTNSSINDGDLDNDGIFNYLDSDMDGDGISNSLDANDDGFGNNFTDQNGDGVLDQYDQDRDGVPNFFDLDSDNDGIYDAIEANNGIVPANFSMITGRFIGGDAEDIDNDGVLLHVDPNDGDYNIGQSTTLSNPDLDADGLKDYLDLDSEDDGITDHIEAQSTATYRAPTGLDVNNNGVDDTFEGSNALTPVNTDGADQPDYRDTDSDNDTNTGSIVGDIIEGFDANRNGFSDLDTDLDGLLSDENGFNTDTDGDGLRNIFDSYSGYGTNNILGSRATLQDTDNDGTLDFRDTDDDNDGITTASEDVNSNGIWTDDKAQGGGATPDYLFFNDTDNDKVADGVDADGDNDGIPDAEEYDSVNHPAPFGDADGDGVFNYNDPDNPGGLTDSNGDGIWDEYDWDLDGVPNFFDLDTDNDGIPDIIEVGGTDADNDGKIDGTTDSDSDGIFDNVDIDSAPGNGGSGVDTDGDEIDDSFDVDQTGGDDDDNDSIDDLYDLDVDGDGIINTIDPDEGGTALTNGDFDNDGLKNIYDYDSDNDGILDIIEAGGNDSDNDGKLDGFGDTDGDGWGNSRDADNGGTAFTYPNTDGAPGPNFIDIDSDEDGKYDFQEGFYELDAGNHITSYNQRVTNYNTPSDGRTDYLIVDSSPADGRNDYLNDHDGDGIFNLLDPDNATYYLDDDNDGIINLFDADLGGVAYGRTAAGIPDMDVDGVPNVIDAGDVPLPLHFLTFTGVERDGKTQLQWTTTNEINVSHFEVQHSLTGSDFKGIGIVNAENEAEGINNYSFVHPSPVKGFNFYRIREVDFDEYEDFTEVIKVIVHGESITWTMYPNPTSDFLKVRSNIIIPDAEIELIDMTGKTVLKMDRSNGSNEFELDISHLKEGIYQLKINLPGMVESFRIIKR